MTTQTLLHLLYFLPALISFVLLIFFGKKMNEHKRYHNIFIFLFFLFGQLMIVCLNLGAYYYLKD